MNAQITPLSLPSASNAMTSKTSSRVALRSIRQDRSTKVRASQLVNVAAEEIEWFFTATDTDRSAFRARATIYGWLSTLPVAEQRSLALRFDPTPWPAALEAAGLDSGYSLVLSLISTCAWTPDSRPHHTSHRRAGEYLEAAVSEEGIGVMRSILRRADWDFATALRAYADSRGRAPSVLPRHAA